MDKQIYTEKKQLRSAMKALRADIPHRDDKNARLTANVIKFLRDRDHIFIYNSFGAEADSKKIVRHLLNRGTQIFMPVVSGEEMYAVKVDDATDFVPGVFDIYQPNGIEADKNDIKICICPGLAFDRNGARLGFGKGYYDRFLQGTDTLKAGICFDEQLLNIVPSDAHDIHMDYIITPSMVYKV